MGKAQKRWAAVAAVDQGHYLVADTMSPELKHLFEPGALELRGAISKTMSRSSTSYGSTPRECSDSASDSDAHPPTSGLIDAVVHIIPPLGTSHGCHGSAPGVQDGAALASASLLGAARGPPPGRWDGQGRSGPQPPAAAPPTRLRVSGVPPSYQKDEAVLDCWVATLGKPGACAPLAPPGSWKGRAWQVSAPPGLEGAGVLPGSWQGGRPQVSAPLALEAPTRSAPHLAPPGSWKGGACQRSRPVAIGPPPGLQTSDSLPDRSEVGARARPPRVPPGSWACRAQPRSEPFAIEPPPGLDGAQCHVRCVWQL